MRARRRPAPARGAEQAALTLLPRAARAVFLSVIRPDEAAPDALARARAALDALKAAAGLDGARVETVIEQGDPVTRVTEAARGSGATLIVMGAHDAGWAKEVLLGSTAEAVALAAGRPVLVVPKRLTLEDL